jgi:phage tail P2-like protein
MSDLLPYNATAQERATSESVARLGDVPVPIRDVWNPDTCPANLLAWLAWAFSVDQWDNSWTDAQKRAFIKSSVEIHRRKGTIGAVQDALAALAFDARVQEWFNQSPAGDPFTFNILLEADQIGVPQAALPVLLAVVERTKNLRSHLARVDMSVRSVAGPYLAAAAGLGSEVTLTGYAWATGACNETTICF